MNKISLVFSMILLSAGLTGCQAVLQKAGPKIAAGVNKYCQEPLETRLAIRKQVNELIAPNAVRVTCEGDPTTE